MEKRLLASFVLATCLGLSGQAEAHPHVFVDARTGFSFDDQGRLTALRITWTYDAFTSLSLFDILDLDKDRDGKLNAEDRAKIVAGETDWAEGYMGDTYLEQDGQPVVLARPEAGSARLSDDRISVTFDLPLSTPTAVAGEMVLRLYDPSYYYAYSIVATDAGGGGCGARLVPFKADEATEELQRQLAKLSREDVPEQENVGRLFADEVWVSCD